MVTSGSLFPLQQYEVIPFATKAELILLYDSCQNTTKIFLHTIIQLVFIIRTQGVYCAVGNGLLLGIVSSYVRFCQAPSLRALNQVPAERLALTVGHLPLPAVARFQTLASSYKTSAVVLASG